MSAERKRHARRRSAAPSFLLAGATAAILFGPTQAAVRPSVQASAQTPAQVATYQLDIPAQNLNSALKALALVSRHRLLYSAELVSGRKSTALKGNFTVEEAVKKILAGSGLVYEVGADKLVLIRANDARDSISRRAAAADGLRLVSADTTAQDDSTSRDSKDAGQVVVEGRRERSAPFSSGNIDLTRTADDVLPFQVFTAQDIEQSGASNLAEFFRNRMPQNYITLIPEESPINGKLQAVRSAQNTFSLANGAGGALGTSELVILVNGRRLQNRHESTQGETAIGFGDFRGIPVASIERVEVLTSAASAIYGAGATGGVINIITKQNYRGGTLSVGYESPVAAHAPKRSVDFNYATPMKWGTNLRATASLHDARPLTLGDRAEVTQARWRSIIAQRQPTMLFSGAAFPWAATPNIALMSSTSTVTGYTSVPDGYAGGQGLAPFENRMGVLNLELPDGGYGANVYGKQSRLGAEQSNFSIGLGADKSFGEDWRISFDYRHGENDMRGQSFSSYGTELMVNADAPTNPFGQTVYIRAYDPGLDRPELGGVIKQVTDQAALSLRGSRGRWHGLFDASYSVDEEFYSARQFMAPLGGGYSGFGPAIASGLYNPFVDMRTTAPAPASLYEEYDQDVLEAGGETRNYQITAKVSGPAFALPAGEMQLTAGVEWLRQDRHRGYRRQQWGVNSKTGQDALYIENSEELYDGRGRLLYTSVADTYSMYAESTVPVVSPEWRIPWVQRLEMFAAGRVSRQSIAGFSYSFSTHPEKYETEPHLYVAGLRYDIVDGLALRVSRSIGFKPPTFRQTVEPLPPSSATTVTDRTINQTVRLQPSMYIVGGNPGLDPEDTLSTNIGLIVAPEWIEGMRVSVDYVESIRDTAITSLGVQTVLDLEAGDPRIAARVQRDAAGNIAFVNARNINFRQISSKTMDLTLQQNVENIRGGRLVLSAAATKNISFSIQTSAAARSVEQVRNPNATYGSSFAEWNANAQVRWEGRQWTLGWSTRYYDDMPIRAFYHVAQGSDRIPSALDHDAFVSYRVAGQGRVGLFGGVLSGMSFSGGVKNVFDRNPRFDAANSVTGTYGADSLYGRTLWFQGRKGF